ncbi:MAG: hypothetical protein EA359_16475 [Balneolaceae bacterium]|nr:MAG: hypothetical protein EA359_16475 [Balneolaceae bacterium]
MSIELIILFTGIVLVSLAIIGGIMLNNQTKGVFVIVTMGVIGIGLISYGGFTYGMLNQMGQMEYYATASKLDVEYPIQRVQVISPVENDRVQCRILTMGVYPEGHEKDIWVLLMPTDNMYYPQSDHTNTSFKRNGEWQVITRFGGSEDEPYELIVYETDEFASDFFTAIIEEWQRNLFYPGLTEEEIPETAIEVDRITISLAENCRGVF